MIQQARETVNDYLHSICKFQHVKIANNGNEKRKNHIGSPSSS
jgi:hypothetical protein